MAEEAREAYEEEGKVADGQPGLRGHQRIKAYLNSLDSSPGVYRMLGEKGEVLYVGKARNLRKRVASYAKPTGHSARIEGMIALTASMMFLSTHTETEALLLEQNLIKQLKPRFNVLLRDDKSFPNILITLNHDYPKLSKHRGKKSLPGHYYGPFASAGAVNRTLNQLQKVFLLRSCSDTDFESRTRACLLHQIKRCSGPCMGYISKEDYAALVSDADRFLSGKTTGVQESLAAKMAEASEAMEYEKAASYRDRISALTKVQSSQGVNPRSVAEADVVAVYQEADQACVQVFFIRANQNWGNRAYFPKTGSGAEAEEILEAFIGQFYGSRQPPKALLLSHPLENPDLVAEMLRSRRQGKVSLEFPRLGEKAELVMNATRNARESLQRRLADLSSQSRLLEDLGKAFGLKAAPRRVEVYDNSHIQGRHAVGAMIVAGPEGFMKSDYRKFNIGPEDVTPGDDFGMMRAVLGRRLSRLAREDPERESGNWPDLMLIDGGAGQVSAVHDAMSELGVEGIPVVGVAKGVDRDAGREQFHRHGRRVMALRGGDPVLYFIQRLRDEAHRFAIGAHRLRRSKAFGATPLDEVPGVGAARKRALLAHFGSAKEVGRAGLADLKAVEGISAQMAEAIYDFFHEKE